MMGVWFLSSKKNSIIIFQKGKGNTFTLLIIFIVKSLKKSKVAEIYYYEPQSAEINVQLPKSESTPIRLTLVQMVFFFKFSIIVQSEFHPNFSWQSKWPHLIFKYF